MKTEKIVIEPFQFLNYLTWECVKELNEHGILRVTGIISQDKKAEYLQKCGENERVCVSLQDEYQNKKIFFNGMITKLKMKEENLVTLLTIEVKTESYALDLFPHICSFQKEEKCWKEIIEEAVGKENGEVIIRERGKESVPEFLFQYQESIWEFAKRMAGRMGTVLLPEFSTEGKRFYMGLNKETRKEITESSYEILRSYQPFCQETGQNMIEDIEYKVSSRELYELGESVWFQKRVWVVRKIISQIKAGELCHEYYLAAKPNCRVNFYENPFLRGLSLKANITGVKNSSVRIRIQKDENQEEGECWFEYATVYSSGDGTGWYCMPEIGDEVRLLFPDGEEKHAYVASCVHLNTSERNDPSRKSWKNKQGKEIVFTPDSILLQNNQGLFLELSDQRGIRISSDKNIVLQSLGDVEIKSETGGVHLEADKGIALNQGGAHIEMNDKIRIMGGKIYMN